MSFSSVIIGQVPSQYTIIKTHNDDITWYEVRNDEGGLGVVYNGKVVAYCIHNAVSYSHGYFFCQYQGGRYSVYDKYGNEPRFGVSNRVDGYEVIEGNLYIEADYAIFDENRKEVGIGLEKVGNKTYLIIEENGKYGVKDLTDGKQVLLPYDEYQIKKILFKEYEMVGEKIYFCINDYFKSGEAVYDDNFNKIGACLIKNGSKTYLKTQENGKFGLKDLSNDKHILSPVFNRIEIVNGSNGELFIRAWRDSHSGFYDISGEEILAPEFNDCGYMGNDLFKFKMNGYWGVMNRQGKIIIPLSRHYTQIDYSRTLKTFTFVKEGGYKGECNASGTQTSIAKVQQPKPQQQAQQPKQETKPQQPKQETVTRTPTSTSSSSSSTSSTTNGSGNDKGLLYKGEYTICRSRQYDELTGNPMGISASDETQVVEIYEDHVYLGVHYCEYQSTNNRGERVYKDNLNKDATLYVSPNFDIRYYWSMTSMYGSCNVVIPVEKGASYMSGGNGGYSAPQQGGYNGGNIGGNNGGNSGSNTSTSSKTHKCSLCNGTGRVIENNATSYGNTKYCSECGKTVPDYHYHTTCPSCNGKGYW